MGSGLTKHNYECERIRKAIENNSIGKHNETLAKRHNRENVVKTVDEIVQALQPNEWLFSQEKEYVNKERYMKQFYDRSFRKLKSKPKAIWFSKGDWFFHECATINNITLISVDYTHIYTIASMDDFEKFDKKYGMRDIPDGRPIINWSKVDDDGYKGIAIVHLFDPDKIGKRFQIITKDGNIQRSKWMEYDWFCDYDVSSLAIWDTTCILSSRYLGSFRMLYFDDYETADDKKDESSESDTASWTTSEDTSDDEYYFKTCSGPIVTRIKRK